MATAAGASVGVIGIAVGRGGGGRGPFGTVAVDGVGGGRIPFVVCDVFVVDCVDGLIGTLGTLADESVKELVTVGVGME